MATITGVITVTVFEGASAFSAGAAGGVFTCGLVGAVFGAALGAVDSGSGANSGSGTYSGSGAVGGAAESLRYLSGNSETISRRSDTFALSLNEASFGIFKVRSPPIKVNT